MLDPRKLLSVPAIYLKFKTFVGGHAIEGYVREFLHYQPGEKVFDIGCGCGDLVTLLPGAEYTGIDLSSAYIQKAQAAYGDCGTFRCQDVAEAAAEEPGTYDLVTANGVLHHLNDDSARSLLRLASQLLKPTGRLITLDGCYTSEQSLPARWIVSMDRGRFVRPVEQFQALACAAFPSVRTYVRHKMLRIPYTLLVMECRRSADDAKNRQAA